MPIIFDVSNIFRLYFQRPSDDVVEFPNLAPPYALYWMEAKAPAWAQVNKERKNWPWADEWACLFEAHEISNHVNIKWAIAAYLINSQFNGANAIRVRYYLDKDGRRYFDNNGNCHIYELGPDIVARLGEKLARQYVYQFTAPFLWATCFLHCKNIEAKDVVPAKKLSDIWEKQSGRPLVKYKTLVISPHFRNRPGATSGLGVRMNPLHICRGHFKQFDDRPLFGKYRGLFWWESQIRGNKKQGVVLKDYKIREKDETEA